MPLRLSHSCRQFRRQHVEYVDGFLVADAIRECETHLDECDDCRRHDLRVRRSLLALQALREIEPSADFHRRLCDRLARETTHYAPAAPHRMRWGIASAMIAASAALLITTPRPADAPRSSAVVESATLFGALAPSESSPPAVPGAPVSPRNEQREQNRPVKSATLAAQREGRFEAVPGRPPLRTDPLMPRSQSARLQTVTFIGQ